MLVLMARTILVVDDEPTLRETLVEGLEDEGFRVVSAADGREAIAQFRASAPDLVLLDLMLPELSGIEVCRAIRAESGVPILMLTARDSELDKVVGLELGADDYVSKPFSPRELLARVRGMLRRAQMQAPVQRRSSDTGPFDIDIAGQRISLHGRVLALTRREFGLLSDLLQHRNRIRSREELLHAVWGSGSARMDRTVDTHIKTLRAKLQEVAPGHDYIATHRGMGYSI